LTRTSLERKSLERKSLERKEGLRVSWTCGVSWHYGNMVRFQLCGRIHDCESAKADSTAGKATASGMRWRISVIQIYWYGWTDEQRSRASNE